MMSSVLSLNEFGQCHFNEVYIIAPTGLSLGAIILSVLSGYLQKTYGWRGAMLIIGGLSANLVPDRNDDIGKTRTTFM